MIAPGSRVGAFEVLARLGAGGQGEVCLAWPWREPARRRRVRRSVLRATLAAGAIGPALAARMGLAALKLAWPGSADSLHDEHGHLAALAHPHLPRLYGRERPGAPPDLFLGHLPGAAGPRLALALVYEAGVTLELLLARRRLGPGPAVAVAAQVAQALAFLHGRGVVHHDVRPANLIVRRGPVGAAPHVVLIDLGAAETPARPRRRAVYGAVGHLPPERVGPKPGPASPLGDIFGLGTLLGLMARGGPVSPQLAALIAEATAPDPGRRGAALPAMTVFLARLADLPEARGGRVAGLLLPG